MKKIKAVFTGDIKRIMKNVIAIIVIIGVCVVPSLYAWFNIAGSWDPYGNTGQLKIAVANSDEGYQGSLIKNKINIGDEVIGSLKGNEQLDWQFVVEKKAIAGVEEGLYYAAIIIPSDFSKNIMSLFSDDIETSEIIYYSNEKENAIAPKVTDKGTEAIKEQINSLFMKNIAEITLEAMQAVYETADEESSDTILGNLKKNLENMQEDVQSTAKTVSSFKDLVSSIRELLDSTGTFIKTVGDNTAKNAGTLVDAEGATQDMQGVFDTTFDGIDSIFDASNQSYQQIADEIYDAFNSINESVPGATSSFDGIADELQTLVDHITDIRNALAQLGVDDPTISDSIAPLIGQLDQMLNQQEALINQLAETQGNVDALPGVVADDYNSLEQVITDGQSTFTDMANDYQNNIKPQLSDMFSGLSFASGDVSDMLKQVGANTDNVANITGETVADLKSAEGILENAGKQLETIDTHLEDVLKEIKHSLAGDNLKGLEELLSGSPTDVGQFLAAPVEIKTEAIYPVVNYGSAMAPFYTILSIWVGGVVLVAMIKTNVSEKTEKKMALKPYQAYFGRYISFLILGLVQSTLTMLGNLYFLGIQCEHPILLMLVGWVSSIVFVNIIFTLTISFGDVGKAIAVVFMVLQVAGSGGSFPIEVLPQFFRNLYPFMPFAHSMTAMRECIAGMYHNTYWRELGYLLCFMVPSLLLGLVLRKPIIKFNKLVAEKLESTHLM